jgi:phospho-N-acetylmuramoyl-pentapeptide-transferase
MAVVTGVIIGVIMGPLVIRYLRKKQIGQSVRDDGPESHLSKQGTPTMGGLIILSSVLGTVLLWADLTNPAIWSVIFITLTYGIVGWVDDWKKVVLKDAKGISARQKMFWLLIPAFLVSWFFWKSPQFETVLHFPFFKEASIDMGWWYIPFSMCVIVGCSNAVNLTDGLDGLAIGPVISSFATYALLAYLAGHHKIAGYLAIPFVSVSAEVTVFCAAMIAAGLGFLWFNSYPAQVFMGDVGSLSLGGALGTLLIVGGVFVIETLSVIIQVASFRMTGKRVFRMAPIHHHFELKGWAEPKVIVRFWILSWILAILALSTLKLR